MTTNLNYLICETDQLRAALNDVFDTLWKEGHGGDLQSLFSVCGGVNANDSIPDHLKAMEPKYLLLIGRCFALTYADFIITISQPKVE